MLGKIHSFQSLGTLDGPGVRFVAFMHGCNLHCGYCHNIDVCKGDYSEYSAFEVYQKLIRYKEYFADNGGLTVSGGEPLLQAEFVDELFDLCNKNNIHTCLDTSGSVWNDNINHLLDKTDLVMLDIKMAKEEDYQKYIGCSIKQPINFLKKIEEKGKKCWIRYVVVEGLNDADSDILQLKELISDFKCIEKIELLPFRKICSAKYENMNIDFPFKKYPETSQKTIDRLYKIIKNPQ